MFYYVIIAYILLIPNDINIKEATYYREKAKLENMKMERLYLMSNLEFN